MDISGLQQNSAQKLLKKMSNNKPLNGQKINIDSRMSMEKSVFDSKDNVSAPSNTIQTQKLQIGNITTNNSAAKTTAPIETKPTVSTQQSSNVIHQHTNDDTNHYDTSNIDFDNLSNTSDIELVKLKNYLNNLKNDNLPRHLEINIRPKLNKVSAEILRRAGNNIIENNDDKSLDNKPEKKTPEMDSGNAAAQGKAAVSDSKQGQTDAKSGTAQTQQHAQDMQDSAKEMKTTDKKLLKNKKADENFIKAKKSKIQKDQKIIQKNSKQLEINNKEAEQLNAEIQTKNSEMASATPETQASIQSSIQASTAKLNAKQTNIARLTQTSKKLVKTVNRNTSAIQKRSTTSVKNIKIATSTIINNKSTADKVLDVANKVGEVSSYVSTIGQTTQYVAKGMDAVGKAMTSNPYTATAGVALQNTALVTDKVGETTKLVGDYGTMAANTTKSITYATQGNIAGAITSAGAAAMSAASAVKGTKALQGSFKNISSEFAKHSADAAQKLSLKAASTTSEKVVSKATEGAEKFAAKAIGQAGSSASLEQVTAQGAKAFGNTLQTATKTTADKVSEGLMAAGSTLGSAGSTLSEYIANKDTNDVKQPTSYTMTNNKRKVINGRYGR